MANEDTPAILEAAVQMWEGSPPRSAPSPSSVMDCYRRNYFNQTRVPRTERPDAESSIAAESGKATEFLMLSLIQNAGIADIEHQTDEEREIPQELLSQMNLLGGQYDALGTTPEGERILIELKRKSVFPILKLHQGTGLSEVDEREYMQIQAMLHMLGLERCFYLAANWDRGALTFSGKKSVGRVGENGGLLVDGRIPGVYTEWIKANPVSVRVIQTRGQKLQDYLQLEDASQVPREYTPGKDWQCDWCGWKKACLAAK